VTDITELERRVSALEAVHYDTNQTQRWVVAKLGEMSAVQEQHSLRLERVEGDVQELKADVREVKADVRELKADLKGLRADLPRIIGDVMREVLKER
jgi:seryl-tRNA synthetase